MHKSDIETEVVATLSVSIALCTFNGERFLQDQLQSFLHQDYPISELVVFDDNSTDTTKDILIVFYQDCQY